MSVGSEYLYLKNLDFWLMEVSVLISINEDITDTTVECLCDCTCVQVQDEVQTAFNFVDLGTPTVSYIIALLQWSALDYIHCVPVTVIC